MKNLIVPTKKSLSKVEHISKNMYGHTFHHHFHILWDIRNLIEKEEINYLEIGTYAGGSASLMLQHPNKTNVFGLDLETSPRHEEVYQNVKKFNKGNNFEYFIGNSRDSETVTKIIEHVKNVDMLFIDGEHSFDAIIDDFLNFKDLVNDGGYIIFDDYNDLGYNPIVKHAVDFIVNEYLFDEYDVIGYVYNKLKAHPSDMIYNNEFIIRKKIK